MTEEQTKALVAIILAAEYVHNLENIQGCKAFDELETVGWEIKEFRERFPSVLPPNPEELETDQLFAYPDQNRTGD